VTQVIQALAREARWLMNMELRGLWLDHPGRDRAQFTVRTDDGDDLLTAAGYVSLPDSDDLPVIRVVPVADRDLFTVL
jgi:hypothetical protein